MGTIASQESPESAPPEEGGARATILAAARSVAEREGVIEMTLTGVAREAHVTAGDIYALFTSKNDLLQAVVADDLANLAKAMRRSFGGAENVQAADPDASGPAVLSPLQRTTGTADAVADEPAQKTNQIGETQGSSMSAAEAQQSNDRHDHEPGVPVQAQELPRRYPVVQARREANRSPMTDSNAGTIEAIAQLQEAVTKLESRPVDAWLERRLREFERGLAALQDNQAGRAAAKGSVEQEMQALREAIEALSQGQTAAAKESVRAVAGRLVDEIEIRLREKLSDLETEYVHLARRVTALENLAFASRPEAAAPMAEPAPAPAAAPESAPEVAEVAVQPLPHDSTMAFDDLRDGSGSQPSYLSAARRSAQAAAKASEDVEPEKIPEPKSRRILYAACGSLFLFVLLLAVAGYVLKTGVMTANPIREAEQIGPALIAHTTPVSAVPRKPLSSAAKPLPRATQGAPSSSLRKLADSGDPSAELLLGLQYLEGRVVAKNETMAVDWLSRAAAKGQPVAQYDLGALYADGRGVPADAVQAFQWFGAAALRGNRRAMHFLAIAYAEGVGTTKNLPEAARWFERAATQGAVNSQFNIAVLYERGMGVPQNLVTAYKWYAIAAAQGDHEAQARVTALASTLKPEDLASAKAAAEAFKPEPLDPATNLPPKLPS